MADRKITELPAMSAGSQATGDLLTIVDVSEAAATDKNKKITVESLFQGIPGNVGIGTSSPSTKLHISDSAAPEFRIVDTTNNCTGFMRPVDSSVRFGTGSNHPLQFFVNSSEKARIDSSGNVGIGETSVQSTLHVAKNIADSDAISWANSQLSVATPIAGNSTANRATIYFAPYGSDNNYAPSAISASAGTSGASTLKFFTNASGNLTGQVQSYERLRIDSSGNVGIGVSTLSSSSRLTLLESAGNGQTLEIKGANTGGPGSQPGIKFTASTGDNIGGIFGDTNSDAVILQTGGTERLRIDSSGNIGIGITDPGYKLEIGGNSNIQLALTANTTSGNSQIYFGDSGDDDAGALIYRHASDSLAFEVNASERMRIDSSGRLLVNTTAAGDGDADELTLAGSGNSGLTIRSGTSSSGNIFFSDTTSNSGTDKYDGYIQYRHSDRALLLATAATERMRIDNAGKLLVGTTASDMVNNSSGGGCALDSGGINASASGEVVANFNRSTEDGTIVTFRSQGANEGSVSISGSTTSFNGGHLSRWSQLAGGAERTEILRGSVLSNLDEMCVWGEEDNEQLNRMKVSDVEGDVNVSGVFQCWDDDDDTFTNDFFCAMTGDFVIRIAEGTTVARGDLLMSAGDGTAKPQDDDIIRSKTIAKVTSTVVSTTYADGSYCVPCVLVAC